MKALSIVLSVIAALLIALIAVFLLGGALDADVSVATLPAAQDALRLRRRRGKRAERAGGCAIYVTPWRARTPPITR